MIRVETKKTESGKGLQFIFHKQGYHTVTDTITGNKNSLFVSHLNRDNLFSKMPGKKMCKLVYN